MTSLVLRVAHRFTKSSADDLKKVVEKSIRYAEKDLKKFLATLPEGTAPGMSTKVESRHKIGQFGPYEMGEFSMGYGRFRASITGDVPTGTFTIGASVGSITLDRLWAKDLSAKELPAKLKNVLAYAKQWAKEQSDKAVAEAAKRSQPKPEVDEVWSVAQIGTNHSYVTEVDTYTSKSKAMQAARDAGGGYVMRGRQMENEPLGQVEDSDRHAKYEWVK